MNDKKIVFWCVDSAEETPDLIPNSAVKLGCGEGSARATWCENSKMHQSFYKKAIRKGGFFISRMEWQPIAPAVAA